MIMKVCKNYQAQPPTIETVGANLRSYGQSIAKFYLSLRILSYVHSPTKV